MSLQTVVRPSALPLPKSLSSSTPSVATKGLMVIDRQRRGGSTTPPYRSILPVYQRPPETLATAVQKRLKRPFNDSKNAPIVRRHSSRTSEARPTKKLSDCGRKVSDSSVISRKPSSCSSDSNSGTPKSGRKTTPVIIRKDSMSLRSVRKVSSSSVESNSPGLNKKISRTSSSASDKRNAKPSQPSLKPTATTKAAGRLSRLWQKRRDRFITGKKRFTVFLIF